MCSLSIKTNLNKNKNVFTPLGEPVFSPSEQFSAFLEPAFTHLYSISECSVIADDDIVSRVFFSILSDYLPFSIASFNGSLALKQTLCYLSKNNFISPRRTRSSYLPISLSITYSRSLNEIDI